MLRFAGPLSLLLLLAAPRAASGEDAPARRAVEAYLREAEPPGPAGPGELARVAAAADARSPWTFHFALYLWATGVEGEVGAQNLSAPVDVPFSELFDDLTGAFMARFGAQRGRWGILLDVFWSALEDEQGGPAAIRTEIDLLLAELTVAYRVVDHDRLALDAYAGGRAHVVDVAITTPLESRGQDETWVDPILGLDLRYRKNRWLFGVRADIGGFGISSELCWSLMAGVAFECSRTVWLSAGYRWLDVDHETGGRAFLDLRLSGPFAALVLVW